MKAPNSWIAKRALDNRIRKLILPKIKTLSQMEREKW